MGRVGVRPHALGDGQLEGGAVLRKEGVRIRDVLSQWREGGVTAGQDQPREVGPTPENMKKENVQFPRIEGCFKI